MCKKVTFCDSEYFEGPVYSAFRKCSYPLTYSTFCCVTASIQNGLNRFGMSWLQSEGKAANKCSAYVRTPSRLLEELPHEAGWENAKSVQSCHRGKGWLLWRISNIKYILICLTLFLVTKWFQMCYFIVFYVFTIIVQFRK